ncbi:hypothetical protein [Nostoc sp.]|uniref:hypothetical protein n=1 Tax=Nostoc sp. TaxID=1180 RepID=UPI002FF52D93
MSQSGLVKFVDTTPAAISRLIAKVRLSNLTVNNLPPCLKPFAGMRLTFAEYSDTQGRVIVEDTFCAAIVEYYAIWLKPRQPRDNIKAQETLRLIQYLGIRVFIHQKTGWNKPAAESTVVLKSREIKKQNNLSQNAAIRDYYDTRPLMDYSAMSKLAANQIRYHDVHPVEAICKALDLYMPKHKAELIPVIENVYKADKRFKAEAKQKRLAAGIQLSLPLGI